MDIRCRAIRQARDDGPAGKDIGVGREHDRGHGSSGRQPGNVNAASVDAVIQRHLVDHLSDRKSLALPPLRIAGLKPVEAAVRIICVLLLGEQQRKAIPPGEGRPSGAVIIAGRRLRASVKDDHECGLIRKAGGQMREHTQGAGIGTEIVNLTQAARSLTKVGHLEPDLPGRAHERLPLFPIVKQIGGRFPKTEH